MSWYARVTCVESSSSANPFYALDALMLASTYSYLKAQLVSHSPIRPSVCS